MEFEISTENLGMDISSIREQVNDLDAAKNQVIRCLTNLNNMWEGQANKVFVSQCLADGNMLQNLIDNLRSLTDCLDYARNEYVRCDEDVRSKIASIRLSNDC